MAAPVVWFYCVVFGVLHEAVCCLFSCSALQASLLPSEEQANASQEEAAENRVCQAYNLSLLGYNIDIPSPTPPFGKTYQVFPCLLSLGIVSKFPLLSLTRSLGKGRGLVAEQVCSRVVLLSLCASYIVCR